MGILSWLLADFKPVVNKEANKTQTTAPPASIPAGSPTPTQTTTPHSHSQSPPTPPTDYYSHYFSERSIRQLGLFLGGAGFFYWSVLITRRAVVRHQLAARLKFYQPNQFAWRSKADMPKKDPLVAVEALNLATLNTLTFAVMAVGGASWALDISSREDLTRIARRRIERGGGGAVDENGEREVAEWMVGLFGIDPNAEEKKEEQPEGDGKGELEGKGEGEGEKKG